MKKSNKPPQRKVTFISAGVELDEKDVAKSLARIVTGGDYAGYVKKVMDKADKI